jgi:protein gp37
VNGKYWEKAWSLVEGCTPVSEACDHCWLKSMTERFHGGTFSEVRMQPDRMQIPLRTRKPTVFAIWSDLFHKEVSKYFIMRVFDVMNNSRPLGHTFVVLTKRPDLMAEWFRWSGA